MKRNLFEKTILVLAILVLLFLPLFLSSCGSNSEDSGSSTGGSTGNIDRFKTALEQDGFTVREVEIKLTDPMDLYNHGIINNCNGNNAGNPYFTYRIPKLPEQPTDNEIENIVWRLRPDEAIVLVGKTPPEMLYFSYRSFLFTRYNPEIGEHQKLYASLGDTINKLTVSTEGSPNGDDGNPFNQNVMIITTADRGIDNRVRTAAKSAGYPELIMNTDVIPSAMVTMGLDESADTFSFLHRTAMPIDQEAFEAYENDPGLRVFRLTPTATTVLDPYPTPELAKRGTGETEFYLWDSVENLRQAIINHYSAEYDAQELVTDIWLPEGYEGIQSWMDCLGESRDTTYLHTNKESQFILPDDPDVFLVVYGVNHTATKKCTYSNFVIYGANINNGVASIDSESFPGSAQVYLPDDANSQYMYAWKVSRQSDGSAHCLTVPSDNGAYGIPLDQTLFVGFRSYLEVATEVGPNWPEMIYDRVIRFTRRSQ